MHHEITTYSYNATTLILWGLLLGAGFCIMAGIGAPVVLALLLILGAIGVTISPPVRILVSRKIGPVRGGRLEEPRD